MDNDVVTHTSMNPISKKEKYLITLNKFKRITFFGTCKVEINKTDKCLIFRTNATEKKFQEFASTFNRIFVQKENALCIIDATSNKDLIFRTNAVEKRFQEFASTFNRIFVQKENALCILDAISNKDFIVIFPLKSTCDRIMEEINKVKFPSGPPTSDPATDDYLFKTNFYVPILKEIQSKITGFMEIKTVILDLVNHFEADQRQTYMNMVFEILLSSANSSIHNLTVNESSAITTENDKARVVENDETFHDDTLNSTDNQSLNDPATINSSYSFRKRSAVDYSSYNVSSSNSSMHESSFGTPSKKKSRKSSVVSIQMSTTSSSSNETLTASYEFVECFRHGAIRRRILIFTSDEKDKCYEFYYSDKDNIRYHCKGCLQMHHRTTIYPISVYNGKIEFKFGCNHHHICQPFSYLPDSYKIKQLPALNLRLSNKQETVSKKIIKSPNFQLLQQKYADRLCSKLIIFHADDKNLCYEYSLYQRRRNQYRCNECKEKFNHYVYARIIKDEEGDNVAELGLNEHLCKPKIFDHEKQEVAPTPKAALKLRRIQKSNFKIEMVPHKYKSAKPVKTLFICDPDYGNQKFAYYYHSTYNGFYCKDCMKKSKKYVIAKFVKDENGEECLELSDVKHVCL